MSLRFFAVVSTLTSLVLFSVFCWTVRSFPEGSIVIDAPGGIRIETRLGESKPPSIDEL